MSDKLISLSGLSEYHNGIKNSLVPKGGSERQILSWKGSGEAKWTDLASVFTGLEEILA